MFIEVVTENMEQLETEQIIFQSDYLKKKKKQTK